MGRSKHALLSFLVGRAEQHRWSAFAEAQALAAQPNGAAARAGGARRTESAFEFSAKFLRTLRHAGNVIANVRDNFWARLERKHPIERRYAVNFGGRNVQTQRNIVQRAWADPTNAILYGVQHGKQAMSPAVRVAVVRRARI